MFNQKLKEMFIETFSDDQKKKIVAKRLFAISEPHEERWKSDIYMQNVGILKEVLGELLGYEEKVY